MGANEKAREVEKTGYAKLSEFRKHMPVVEETERARALDVTSPNCQDREQAGN